VSKGSKKKQTNRQNTFFSLVRSSSELQLLIFFNFFFQRKGVWLFVFSVIKLYNIYNNI
jgi:hypothetical protein